MLNANVEGIYAIYEQINEIDILATKIQLLGCTYLGCCLSIFYVTSQMHGTLSRNQNQLKTVGSVSFNCDEQLWCCSVDTSFYVYI